MKTQTVRGAIRCSPAESAAFHHRAPHQRRTESRPPCRPVNGGVAEKIAAQEPYCERFGTIVEGGDASDAELLRHGTGNSSAVAATRPSGALAFSTEIGR